MNARNAYVTSSVQSASPSRILVRLIERLARDVEQAAVAQADGDLASIYGWLHSELVRANTTRDAAITRDCQRLVDPLVETWREAALVAAAG